MKLFGEVTKNMCMFCFQNYANLDANHVLWSIIPIVLWQDGFMTLKPKGREQGLCGSVSDALLWAFDHPSSAAVSQDSAWCAELFSMFVKNLCLLSYVGYCCFPKRDRYHVCQQSRLTICCRNILCEPITTFLSKLSDNFLYKAPRNMLAHR